MEANDDLQARAARLYPNSEYLQQEWIRSVRELRAGRGWLMDAGTRAPDMGRPEVLTRDRAQALN